MGMVGWICSPESEARHLQGSGFACHVGSVGCAGKTMAQASQMLEAHPPSPVLPCSSLELWVGTSNRITKGEKSLTYDSYAQFETSRASGPEGA